MPTEFLILLKSNSPFCFIFFFQAEDGIRDHCVTGVQTCALPISLVESVQITDAQALLNAVEKAAGVDALPFLHWQVIIGSRTPVARQDSFTATAELLK